MSKTYKRNAAGQKLIDVLLALSKKGVATCADVAKETGLPYGTVMCQLYTLSDNQMAEISGGNVKLGFRAALPWASFKSMRESDKLKAEDDLKRILIGDE